MIRKILFVVCLAMFACLIVSSAQAGIVYTLQVSDVQTPGTTRVDATHATVERAGDVVNFDVWGVITTGDAAAPLANPATSGVLVCNLSFLKTGGMAGNLAATLSSQLAGTASSNGIQADLNGDGSMDVGSNLLTNAATGFFTGTSTGGTNPIFGNQILLGTLSFTAGDLAAGPTTINARARGSTGAAAGANSLQQFRLDGTNVLAGKGTGTPDAFVFTNPVIFSGAAVTVSPVPEPSTIILLGMGALALVFIRRRK
jgi:hypothetical protein